MAERTDVAIRHSVHDEVPERSAIVIRRDIAAKRESISETVEKLEERIQKTLDWREYVSSYPAVAIGLAAGAGFLIAGIFKRNPTPQERIRDALADLTEDLTSRAGDVIGGVIQKQFVTRRTLTAAATTMMARAAVDYLTKRMSDAMARRNQEEHSNTTSSTAAFNNNDTDLQPSVSSAAIGGTGTN